MQGEKKNSVEIQDVLHKLPASIQTLIHTSHPQTQIVRILQAE